MVMSLGGSRAASHGIWIEGSIKMNFGDSLVRIAKVFLPEQVWFERLPRSISSARPSARQRHK
jgi:hypothetical protein